MKKCVVSFADEAGYYRARMQRLKDSLQGRFDGDFLGFTGYEEIGCEHHRVIPYKFKAYAIKKAIDLGYELVLWADSAVYATKNIQPVFDHIQNNGYVFFDNIGFSLGDYTNDKTLSHFDISRDESHQIKMIMACCMGFDFTRPEIRSVFNQYLEVADQLYPGKWNNNEQTESKDPRCKGHRHDQSVISAIIHCNNLDIIKGQDTFFAYKDHENVMKIASSVCLLSQG